MERVHQDTGLPVTEAQIRAEHPGLLSVGPGFDLSGLGFPWLVEVPSPGPDYQRGANQLVGGEWRMTWERPPLADQKAAKTAEINALRDQKETEGFTYLGKPWDSDERSVKRIYGAVLSAQAAIAAGVPEAFSVEWTFADNTSQVLGAQEMTGAPAAMAQRADLLHQYTRTLKQAVAEADQAALDALDITAGWPQ